MFAAWPMMYAAAFSVLLAMLIVLAALHLPSGRLDFRSVAATRWRSTWTGPSSARLGCPADHLGVASNLLQGVPFEIDATPVRSTRLVPGS